MDSCSFCAPVLDTHISCPPPPAPVFPKRVVILLLQLIANVKGKTENPKYLQRVLQVCFYCHKNDCSLLVMETIELVL